MFISLLYEFVRLMLVGCLLATLAIVLVSGTYYGIRTRRLRTRTPPRARQRNRSRTGVRLP